MMSEMVSTRGRVVTGQMGVGTAAFQAGPNALFRPDWDALNRTDQGPVLTTGFILRSRARGS
jgi:hypothetical protein